MVAVAWDEVMSANHQASPGRLAEHLREFSSEVAELKGAGLDSLTDTLAHWLSAHYAGAARRVAEEAGDAGLPLTVLHSLSADIVALRKGDHSAARLALEREWLEVERQKTKERMEKQFEQWMQQPEVRDRFRPSKLSEEERAERIRDILGMPRRDTAGLSPEALAEIEHAAKIL
ncbi:MAG: hypothetical protein ABJF10_16300 [Chthoniobacter sp.]|uniref:hypothetical protein n=1 Tax=Chthoniobacter sp. TaxID=2510640 RepID=UPI0032A17173